MPTTLLRPFVRAGLAAATLLALTFPARGHYIWLTVEPGETPGVSTLRAFFNEPPLPDTEFVKYVKDLPLTVNGLPLPSTLTEESRDARWLGQAPTMVDAARDLGVMTRGGKSFRLMYTARAQTAPVAADAKEAGDRLRVRLIQVENEPKVEVLFDGKPVPHARLRVYPEQGNPTETVADATGRATVAGLAEGKSALWAHWADATPGESGGKAFTETRYYATFTYNPATASGSAWAATTFATMPAPAVNSFGGAVLGDWLYVYSGHVGRTHRYNTETTAKRFRRLNLADRSTWEDLPMGPDLQGLALVTDGRFLYRVGGMSAKNKPGEADDLHSVADFARFDPVSKTWTDLPPMPRPRSTHDALVIGRTVYVVGGWTMKGEAAESEFLEDALAFDLDKPEAGWRSIPQPFRRRALSIGEHGGRLYVLGGLSGITMKAERRVDVYDPARGVWSRGPDLPAAGGNEGFGTSAFRVGDHLYVSGMSGRILRLTAAGDAWEPVGGWAFPRITHRLLPGPGLSLLAVGGTARREATPVIERVDLREPRPTESAAGGQ